MKNNVDNNVYANNEEFVDFSNERKKCVVMSIKSNKKDIAIDTTMMAANAFTVGVGILGTYVYGKKFIEYCSVKEHSTVKRGIITVLHGVPIILSGTQVVLGIKGFVNRKNELKKDIAYRKTLVKRLEKMG